MNRIVREQPGRDVLLHDCLHALHQVSAAMTRVASPEWLALDLPMGQLKALRALETYGPQHVGQLGGRLALSEPAASLLIDKLEQRGMVTRGRDVQDRRRCTVALTPAAVDLMARLHQGRDENLTRWLSCLTTQELEGLLRGVRGLVRASAEARDE